MIKIIHPIAGGVAFLTIATFWLSTLGAELFGTQAQIVAVKTAIPYGFLILIPAMAVVGGTGLSRAGKRRGGVLGKKVKRMPILAANGLLVLIPSALFLAWKAQNGQFDALFFAIQALELIAGAINLTLLAQSMRDGFALSGRFRRRVVRT